jgi:DNA-directed RNA polymerase subunit omega
MNTLLKNMPSRYLLVNVAAQRARSIADRAESERIPLNEKPVKIAVNEIADGKLVGVMKTQHSLGDSR